MTPTGWLAMGGGFLAVVATAAFLYGVIGPEATPADTRIVPPIATIDGRVDTVLVLGTSLSSRGTWLEDLQARLRTCAPSLQVERLAKAGASSRWGLATLQAHLAANPAPDILVVEFSGNDAALLRGFPLFVSERLTQRIVEEAQAAGAMVLLSTMSPAFGRKALERPGQDRYHALYRDIARDRGLGLVDTIEDWRGLPPEVRTSYLPDNLHPTPEGMLQVAVPAFEEALRPLVCATRAGA